MPRLSRNARQWAADVRHVEDLGYAAVAVSEHYCDGWTVDALTAMNFAVASTTRLRAMPLVLNNDLHHPAILAKAIATADVLSSGRVMLGLGAGWLGADYEALGVALDSAAIRIERLDEALQVIESFFADTSVNFEGEHYQLTDLEPLPRPVQTPRPPILVGGGGPKMLALAGRHADIVGMNPQLGPAGFTEASAAGMTRASIDKKVGMIGSAASEAGRPMPELQFTCYDVNLDGEQLTRVRPAFTEFIDSHAAEFADSPTSLRGDVDKCVDDIQRWQEELGISYWHLGPDVQAIAPIVARLGSE
jgi:probable F420-dependent oxidoreductase